MAYLGNTPTQQSFTPAVDFFSGNGSTVAFTLSRPVASVAQVQATIENVPQNPGTAFTVSGNTITFDGAPPSGTNNIYVYYTSPITQVIQPGQGTVGTAQIQEGAVVTADIANGAVTNTKLDIANLNGTGAASMPTGTTAQRPVTPVLGMFRMNSTLGVPEWYDNTTASWVTFADGVPYNVEYLAVAGGGGGSGFGGGGGGGGGVLQNNTLTVNKGNSYPVTVGAGGSAGTGAPLATNGGNSSIAALVVAIGGGASANDNVANGIAGGSGGGAGTAASSTGVGGAGTAGQGNKGGDQNNQLDRAAGGGGASAAGLNGNANSGRAGDGGAGAAYSITGSSVTYAGGGGGGCRSGASASGGNGGSGGGGRGSDSSTNNPSAGSANTGGGGGGAQGFPAGVSSTGANGGSGIVVIRYLGAQRGTGGTVTSAGGYTIHTFTTSGTYIA